MIMHIWVTLMTYGCVLSPPPVVYFVACHPVTLFKLGGHMNAWDKSVINPFLPPQIPQFQKPPDHNARCCPTYSLEHAKAKEIQIILPTRNRVSIFSKP